MNAEDDAARAETLVVREPRDSIRRPGFQTPMKMDLSRCETADGVLRELTVYAMVYNGSSMVKRRGGRARRRVEPRVRGGDRNRIRL